MTLVSSALKVAKYLGRVNAAGNAFIDLGPEIKAEIGETIRHYNRKPFHLTEFRGGIVTTAADTTWYSTFDMTSGDGEQDATGRNSVDFNQVLNIYHIREATSGEDDTMQRVSIQRFEQLVENSVSGGTPVYYTLYGGSLGIWPAPASAGELYFDGIVKGVVPVDDSDESIWLTEAEELILAGAARRVCVNYLRDDARAQRFADTETLAYSNLWGEYRRKSSTGRIKAHD